MATFPTPVQIQTQYFKILQSIKPSINTNDSSSDFVIRGNVFAAFASGLYGDQAKVDNDTFISTSRPAALTLRGADLGLLQLNPSVSKSIGVTISGTNGTIIAVGQLQFVYTPTGALYTNTTSGVIAGGVLLVAIYALSPGQIGNVSAGGVLQVISPPTGVGASAAITNPIADGTGTETTDSYRSRLLNRLQQPPAGGNANDYRNFAFAADSSVRTVLVRRFGRGLGTVDIYITTGTSDIDTAVTNGLSIVRVPSGTLINNVQAYYNANAPLTDCASVYGPTEIAQNVTINVDLAIGITLSSVPSDSVHNPLGLTVAQLITREIGRALYKVPVGGWQIPGLANGFVVAAYIEQSIDTWLSAEMDPTTGLAIGNIPILADRQVQMLNSPFWDQVIIGNQIVAPGTITTVVGV